MTLQTELTRAATAYEGMIASAVCPTDLDRARSQTLYRATLTADLLDRGEVGEMAAWDCDGMVRVTPCAGERLLVEGTSFVFETPQAAARFMREEVVKRLMDGAFDTEIGLGEAPAFRLPHPTGETYRRAA